MHRYGLIHLRVLLCIVLSLSASAVFSDDHSTDTALLIERARAMHLDTHPAWLALLHARTHDNRGGSDIHSSNFFLSQDSSADPTAELAATISALAMPTTGELDIHARCRFPARTLWLAQMLKWTPPPVSCPNYERWSKRGGFTSVSVIFAGGYFDNPASYYGHLLLRFNSSDIDSSATLLDSTLSYGAFVPPGENGVIYVTKGLFGGYNAGFAQEQFFHYNRLYSENELRDLWEYELDLSSDEVEFLTAHAWELLDKQFTYYFIDDNCATRMAELLEIVVDEPALPQHRPWSIPATVFQRLADMKHHDRPLVRSIKKIASRQNDFYAQYRRLTPQQRDATLTLATQSIDFSRPPYRHLATTDQIGVVDTLLSYDEFLRSAHTDSDSSTTRRQALLIERGRLPPQQRSPDADEADRPPHEANAPSLVRPSWVNNSTLGSDLQLTLRPTYYDLLENERGRPRLSHLTMGEVTVLHRNGRWELRNLDLVRIETLRPSLTGLPGDQQWSWRFAANVGPDNLSCVFCTVPSVAGALGKTIALPADAFAYGMIETRAQSAYEDSGVVAIEPRIGLLATISPAWRSHLSFGERWYAHNSDASRAIVRFENRIGADKRWDIRFGFEKNVAREINAGLSLYW